MLVTLQTQVGRVGEVKQLIADTGFSSGYSPTS